MSILAEIHSLSTIGMESLLITIEVDLHRGLPNFTVVGLGDAAVQESRERVRSAIKNSGFQFPVKRIITSLSPADVRKSGPAFDLPIALGILIAEQQIEPQISLDDALFVGELALNGDLRHITGILSMALAAEKMGKKILFVPAESAREASLANNLSVIPVKNLREMTDILEGKRAIKAEKPMDFSEYTKEEGLVDFRDIRGQESAKRALEIAAAGGHNVLMSGSPGSGKTLMAKAFRSILPDLTRTEAIAVAQIYSVAGLLSKEKPLPTHRPFRMVHHTASAASIVGGGARIRPGEISLAHRGVLFLDELPEFPSQVLEVLRQPLEDRVITISRAQGSVSFPADFTLLSAMNPCPCGYFGVRDAGRECTCSPQIVSRYQKRISGPLLDRIDLHIAVSPVKFEKLAANATGESSREIGKRVQKARSIQKERFAQTSFVSNAEMGTKEVDSFCLLQDDAKKLLQQAMQQFSLSARAFHRILKVARTIADLQNTEQLHITHVAEALQYRTKMESVS